MILLIEVETRNASASMSTARALWLRQDKTKKPRTLKLEGAMNAREVETEVSLNCVTSDEEQVEVEALRKAGLTRGAHQVTCEASLVKLSAQA